MAHVQVPLPLGHARRHVAVIALPVPVRDVARPAHEERTRASGSRARGRSPRVGRTTPDADVLDAGVVDLRVRLDAAAREARGRDAGGVDVGPLAVAAGVVGDKVDGLPHHGVVGAAAAAARGALRDDEDAVGGELREEGRLA